MLGALAAISAGASTQDIIGVWQGTLTAPAVKPERIVLKISKAEGSGVKAVLHLTDAGGQAFAIVLTQHGGDLKLSIPGIGATFEGRLNADGSALAGVWNRGSGPQSLVLKRASAATAWPIVVPRRLKAMPANASPAFEVAAIKRARLGAQGKAIGIRGRQIATANTSVIDLMTFAYGVSARQIVGGPGWLQSEKYNITAKPEGEGQPSKEQWKAMLQKLLTDRWKLTIHREKRELAVYAIVTGKSGSKLTRSEGNTAGMPGVFLKQPGIITGTNAEILDFALVLQTTVFDQPVVDETRLSGKCDFTLTWTPDEFQFGGAGATFQPPADAAPDLFTAMQEQLGLRLVSTKAPVEVIVIERVEKPADN